MFTGNMIGNIISTILDEKPSSFCWKSLKLAFVHIICLQNEQIIINK